MERKSTKFLRYLSHFLAPAREGAAPPHRLSMDMGGRFVQPQFQIPSSLTDTLETQSAASCMEPGWEPSQICLWWEQRETASMGLNPTIGESEWIQTAPGVKQKGRTGLQSKETSLQSAAVDQTLMFSQDWRPRTGIQPFPALRNRAQAQVRTHLSDTQGLEHQQHLLPHPKQYHLPAVHPIDVYIQQNKDITATHASTGQQSLTMLITRATFLSTENLPPFVIAMKHEHFPSCNY